MFEKKLTEFIISEFPQKSADLAEGLELISDILNEIYLLTNDKQSKAFTNRDMQSGKAYIEKMEFLGKAIDAFKEFAAEFEPEEVIPEFEEQNEDTEKRTIPDYSKYKVDNTIAHTLYEEYGNKRPATFEFDGKKVEANTWIDVFFAMCEMLYKKDKQTFYEVLEDSNMQGRKMRYFSLSIDKIRKPLKLTKTDIYIESNLGADQIRRLIIKLIKKFGYSTTDFQVYFRADYTNLKKQEL